jgi:hypothetical protein
MNWTHLWTHLLKHFIYEHIYCSLFNIVLLSTGLWYEKYDTYGKVYNEMFLLNVRSMNILTRVVDAELK